MSHPPCYTRRTKDKENEMKRLLYKHLLRAKYMLEGRYYWKLSTAMKDANNSMHRAIVWTVDYKQAYVQQGAWSHVHPDAANFNTNI